MGPYTSRNNNRNRVDQGSVTPEELQESGISTIATKHLNSKLRNRGRKQDGEGALTGAENLRKSRSPVREEDIRPREGRHRNVPVSGTGL